MRELSFYKRSVSHIILTTILAFCTLFLFSGNAIADIPSSERDALITLYDSTNGDSWTDKTNWNGAAGTENTWYGVTVVSDHVTQINLSSNHLDGTIPSELGGLTGLTDLSLAGNILEGSIPTSLTNLTSLTTLLVDYNALYTDNSSLQSFLDGINPGWDDHQTIAPDNVSITNACFGTSATLTWTPVSYTSDSGGYEVRYGAISGVLNNIVDVPGKTTASTTISGLASDTMYYFAVSSYTDAHPPENANDVYSELSQEASGGLCYDVTFSPNNGSHGSIDGDTSQTIEPGEDCTTVTAVPASNYHFVNWTGTGGFVTTTQNPLNVTNVTSDMNITANFEIDTHTVNFVTSGSGSITGDASQTVDHGGNCSTVTAVPATGYHFTGWTGDYTSSSPSITVTNVTSDMTITANFAINTYTVTFVEGDNGSITGSLTQTVNYMANCTQVTAVPDTHYHFNGWTGDYTSGNNSIIVSNVTSNMTVTANFAIDTHTVTFNTSGSGSITGSTSQTIEHGSDCLTVTAVPATGWHFVNWTGDYTSDSPSITVTNVTANMTITANFEINTYTVTFIEGDNGSITGNLTQTVNYMADCTQVTAVPDSTYQFVNWTGDYTSSDPSITIENVTEDMTITANFALDTYEVEFLTIGSGSITGDTPQTVEHGGSSSTVTAVPDTGYHFVNWTGDYTSSDPSITVTNVTSDMTITANFEINTYEVTFETGENGSITGSLTQTINHGANCSTVTAVPVTPGYHFVNWTGDYTSSDPSITVTNVTSDMTITANFEIDTFTVTFIEGENGSITGGDLIQTTDYNEDCDEVTAVPATGYHFVNWTGDYTSDDPSITIQNVTSEMAITANFEIDTFTVTFIEGENGRITGGDLIQTIDYNNDCDEVTAVPEEGYHFVNWTGTGGFVTTIDNPLDVTNVTSDMTITANFDINTYTVTFIESENGSIDGDLTQTIEHGSDCTEVTAVPVEGHHFLNWTGDYTGGNEILTITNVTSNMTITANFEINEYEVTFTTADDNGNVTGQTDQIIPHGGNCTEVFAEPNGEYRFSFWDGVPIEIANESSLVIENVTSDMVITANFTLKDYDVLFIPGDNGSITGDLTQSIDHGSDCTEVTAVPAIGYHFTGWTGDYTGGSESLTITNVTAYMNITANFEINVYTLTFLPGEHGGLSDNRDQLVPHGADSELVTAYPADGYDFVNWTGVSAEYENENPLRIENITSDMTITANYVLAFDGNNDGTPDAEQDHIKNLTTENQEIVTLEFSDSLTILECGPVDDPSPDSRPTQYDFEYGFFTFIIDDVETGGATTVTIYLTDGASPVTYFKYGRTRRTPTPHWYEFMYDGTTGAEINGNIITLHFVDGERGDDDLTANGKIIDDGGPGFSDTISTPQADDPGDSKGASGGCFIGTTY